MIISKSGQKSGFEIRLKDLCIQINRHLLKINDFLIDEPGEYDINGAMAQVIHLNEKVNILLDVENILIGILNPRANQEELSEDFSKVAILLFFIDQANDLDSATNLVGRIEPQLVFYTSPETISLNQEVQFEKISSNFKVSKNDLLVEGTRNIIFE